MHGLTINFELKRQSKINKVMNYVVVLAFAIFAFVGIVYIPYLAELEKLNEAKDELQLKQNEYDSVLAEESLEGSSQIEFDYCSDYMGLLETQYDFKEMVDNITLTFAEPAYSDITINKISIDDFEKTITINSSFSSNTPSASISNLEYQLRGDLSEIFGNVRCENTDSSASFGHVSTELELIIYYGEN